MEGAVVLLAVREPGAGFGSRRKDWDLNCRCESVHTCFQV